MTDTLWSLVEFAAAPLDRDERDAVLGDSLESGDGPWKALAGVLGLVFRRQLLLWRSWRPWLAAFLLAGPASYLLLYVSVSVTCTSERLLGMNYSPWAPTGHEGPLMLLCHIFLLITWSWTSGFAVGSLSPRTLWASVVVCGLMFIRNELHFLLKLTSPVYSLLFLVPAIWGVQRGIRARRLSLRAALLLATTITALTAAAWIDNALWVPNWFLLFPAWYLVAAASRPPSEKAGSHSRKLPPQLKTSI